MLQNINKWDMDVLLSLNGYLARHNTILSKVFAEYLIYGLPIFLIVFWFTSVAAKKVVLRILFCVVLAWPIISGIVGKLLPRDRPFESGGVQELIFHRPTYSFPSDHAAALFAVTFSLFFSGYKKMGYIFLVLSVIVVFFRVGTGIHWPTDIIAGAVIGLIAAWCVKMLDKYLDRIYELIIKFFKILHLA